MSYNGYAAYRTTQVTTDDPRDLEYRLLGQVTGALMKAQHSTDMREKIDAVLWNSSVWSALRVDLTSEDNQLPRQLRASLISLSIWVDREAHAVIDGHGDIGALIEVNRNIMAGLKPKAYDDTEDATVSVASTVSAY